ncbi:hypothetical protein P7C73_g6410, partial [Tremellales sp. Uapishka_1]
MSAAEPLTTKVASTIKSAGSLVQPADNELTRWRKTFERSASEGSDGIKYLNSSQFIDAIAPTNEGFSRIKREQYSVLFKVADSTRRGLVSFEDFVVFETLLKRPDADYQLAFQVFDVDTSGSIDFDEFKAVLSANIGKDGIPFDFDCDWMKLYLGKRDGSHVLGYHEFTQLIKGYQGERLRQAFHHFDADGDGYIDPTEFQRIIVEIAGLKLSESVLERLPTLCTMNPGKKISYSEVIAFHNIIREMDTVERLIQQAVQKSKDGRIDVSDFLNEGANSTRYGGFTPMEANIIWHFASRGGVGASQRLGTRDFQALLDARWQPPQAVTQEKALTGSFLSELGRSTYNFIQGGIAGGIGAFAVYPIDLVKTRLQNQRSTVVGEVMYRNAGDCIRKVYANEGGVKGFYRGVLPQLVGVAPEKAIKLTINELVRKKATDPETGRITLPMELVAGGTAGGCQVIVTNPLGEHCLWMMATAIDGCGILQRLQRSGEQARLSIRGELTLGFDRLQMAGEITRAEGQGAVPRGAMHVIRQLGLVGLYKGATACICRDVPFKDVFNEGKQGKVLGFGELLTAAAIAGMPAAYLTTPADVIKTRLQSQQRAGQTVYKGVVDGFRKIYQEEGTKALFKGGLARFVSLLHRDGVAFVDTGFPSGRVLRSSPQFGVTLVCYESFHKHFPYPFAAETSEISRPASLSSNTDISRIRARNALRILLDCSSRFGMVDGASAGRGVETLPKVLRG